ncbi:MAG: arylsulfatase [Planctomycetota bacterium]
MHASTDSKPNIIVIVADDLGYSDLGCYGGEIDTPNLDALASGGLRLSQFYNTAKCHSSRVSLLTGQYCKAAGDVKLSHAVTSAEMLGHAGYFTAMTGKWHLSNQPTDFGFARYFGHLSGACNFFYGDKTFRLNGQPWEVPKSGFYTTVANVDFGLRFLEEARQQGGPWHLYVAFNAPHAPLHALPEDYAKYKGRYAAGWDHFRQQRFNKQMEGGLFSASTQPSPRPDHIPAWESLSEARKQFESKRMATLAAMIDRVDQEVGRLVEDLRQAGELDNTLIWFFSDNGACPYDRTSQGVNEEPTDGDVTLGDSTGWAWARNTPFRFYKQNQFEGGIATPSIVHWPAGLQVQAGSIETTPSHLIDVLPTIVEAAGAETITSVGDRQGRPISGRSLLPVFQGELFERTEPIHFLFSQDRAIRDGVWKAVSFRRGPWELYNLDEDRTELNDLANAMPERLESLVEQWHTMASEILHSEERPSSPPGDAPPVKQHPEWTNFSLDPVDGRRGNGGGNKKASAKEPATGKPSIRARKNTRLDISSNVITLHCTGEDPGIALDRLPSSLPQGPYQLAFELASEAVGDGALYFTINPRTVLPKGSEIPFEVMSDGEWRPHTIDLDTTGRIHKLRVDVCDGEGQARVRDMRLLSGTGEVLLRIPGDMRAKGKP